MELDEFSYLGPGYVRNLGSPHMDNTHIVIFYTFDNGDYHQFRYP